MDSNSYFEQVAPRWETMRQTFFSDDLRRIVLEHAGLKPGDVAVDVGAGSGFLCEGLAQSGARVIAVDRSPAMLSELRRRIPGVETHRGEAERLPLGDDIVDRVFANMYLHHVERPAAAVREMVRLLRPGGKLVITDLDAHDHQFLRQEHHDRWPGFARDEVNGWLTEAGLLRVQVTAAHQTCCAASQSGAARAVVSIFLASGIKTGGRLVRTAERPTDAAAIAERGAAMFSAGFYCAESVLQAVAEAYGVTDGWLSRIATGFCGGISRTSGMCGALSGGIMALGLLTGRAAPEDDKRLCYTLTYHLVERFRRHFGSLACADLLGCDIATPEGARHFEQNGLGETICLRITREAAGLTGAVLSEQGGLTHPLLADR